MMKKSEKVTKKPVAKKTSLEEITALEETMCSFHERISVLEYHLADHEDNLKKIERKSSSEKEFRSTVMEGFVIIHNLFVELMEKKSLVGKIRGLFTNK